MFAFLVSKYQSCKCFAQTYYSSSFSSNHAKKTLKKCPITYDRTCSTQSDVRFLSFFVYCTCMIILVAYKRLTILNAILIYTMLLFNLVPMQAFSQSKDPGYEVGYYYSVQHFTFLVIIPCSQYANINLNPSPNPIARPKPNPLD